MYRFWYPEIESQIILMMRNTVRFRKKPLLMSSRSLAVDHRELCNAAPHAKQKSYQPNRRKY